MTSSAAMVMIVAAVFWVVQVPGDTIEARGEQADLELTRTPVTQPPAPADVTPPAPRAAATVVIRDIEAIDVTSLPSLIGRSVRLRVPVTQKLNGHVFWIEHGGTRLLVVQRQDVQTAHGHHRLATHRLLPIHTGQLVDISGAIEAVPSAAVRRSWRLSDENNQLLAGAGAFISADEVRPEGHGE